MRNFIFAFFLFLITNISFAEEKTELEEFSARTGVVKIMGYTSAGRVNGINGGYDSNHVSFQSRILGTPNNPQTTKGILATVMDTSGYSGRSFIDENEIDDLIAGLEYVSNAKTGLTSLKRFEISYETLGGFEVTVYDNYKGNLGVVVESGSRSMRGNFESLAEIISKIKEAKAYLSEN
jgi:hypothetical protein